MAANDTDQGDRFALNVWKLANSHDPDDREFLDALARPGNVAAAALRDILAQVTPTANSTVRRMARIAEAALREMEDGDRP